MLSSRLKGEVVVVVVVGRGGVSEEEERMAQERTKGGERGSGSIWSRVWGVRGDHNLGSHAVSGPCKKESIGPAACCACILGAGHKVNRTRLKVGHRDRRNAKACDRAREEGVSMQEGWLLQGAGQGDSVKGAAIGKGWTRIRQAGGRQVAHPRKLCGGGAAAASFSYLGHSLLKRRRCQMLETPP